MGRVFGRGRLCGCSSSAEGHPMRWGQKALWPSTGRFGVLITLTTGYRLVGACSPVSLLSQCLVVCFSILHKALAPFPVSIYPDIDVLCHACPVLVYGSSVGFCVYEDAVLKGIVGIPRIGVMHMHRWHIDTAVLYMRFLSFLSFLSIITITNRAMPSLQKTTTLHINSSGLWQDLCTMSHPAHDTRQKATRLHTATIQTKRVPNRTLSQPNSQELNYVRRSLIARPNSSDRKILDGDLPFGQLLGCF